MHSQSDVWTVWNMYGINQSCDWQIRSADLKHCKYKLVSKIKKLSILFHSRIGAWRGRKLLYCRRIKLSLEKVIKQQNNMWLRIPSKRFRNELSNKRNWNDWFPSENAAWNQDVYVIWHLDQQCFQLHCQTGFCILANQSVKSNAFNESCLPITVLHTAHPE